MNLDIKTRTVWDNAQPCNCRDQDCKSNHKLCGICKGTIIYTAHESNKEQKNSRYRWNKDHIKPISLFGRDDDISNLQAVHVECNRYKSSDYY